MMRTNISGLPLLIGIAVLWACVPARPAGAVNFNPILLPPPIHYAAPPHVVVLPGTYIYVVPEIDDEVFFFDGYWYRPWKGHWFRSRSFNRGWGHFSSVPVFYRQVPPGWRQDYRNHQWGGQPWKAERITHLQVQKNWSSWKKSRHWEKQRNWGVQGKPPQYREPPRARLPGNQDRLSQVQPRDNQGQRPQAQPAGRPGPKHQDQSGHRNK